MTRRNVFIISVLVIGLIIIGLIAWAPWITEEYAYARVVEHLGGPEVLFNYLGESMPLKNVPKSFKKLPFISLVYFPGEAMFMVTFYGGVI
jgi:hypothetical protein